MSASGADERSQAEDGWQRLEASVQQLLARHDALLERARAAEARAGELEAALDAARADAGASLDLEAELERLKARNGLLEERMADGLSRVRQIAERLRIAQEG